MANLNQNELHPDTVVQNALQRITDTPLIGLWSMVGKFIVYDVEESEEHDPPNIAACNEMFYKDPIAYDLLSAIIMKYYACSCDSINVKLCYNISSIASTMKNYRGAELIAHVGSNFIVVIKNTADNLQLLVWDLRYATND